MWTSPVEAAAGVLAYVDGAPEAHEAFSQIRLTQFAGIGSLEALAAGWTVWDHFDAVAAALSRLVPAAVWETVHGRLVAVVPTGARWEPPTTAALLQAAESLGYDLVVTQDRHDRFDDARTVGWFEADDAVGPDLPVRWTVTATSAGWLVRAAVPPWEAPAARSPSERYASC